MVRFLGYLLALAGAGVGVSAVVVTAATGCDLRDLMGVVLFSFVLSAFLVVPGALMATVGLGDDAGKPVFRWIVGLDAAALVFTGLAMSGRCF